MTPLSQLILLKICLVLCKIATMKTLLVLILSISFLLACNSLQTNNAAVTGDKGNNTTAAFNQDTKQSEAKAASPATSEEILGSYVGQFGDNKITLLVTKAVDGTISGRSIVGGNDRPFDGTYNLENGVYTVIGKEPGDHKDDGVFQFKVAQAKIGELTGTWKPNDAKRPEKAYTLQRKKFEYRADVGNWPQASQRLLKTSDVENLIKEELEKMRNEIFARHGYCFAKKELRKQFENESWYVPNTVNIKGYLTEIEKKNIELIKRYEKYADEYGDEYGR